MYVISQIALYKKLIEISLNPFMLFTCQIKLYQRLFSFSLLCRSKVISYKFLTFLLNNSLTLTCGQSYIYVITANIKKEEMFSQLHK